MTGFMMSFTRVTSGTSTSNDRSSRCSPDPSVSSRSTSRCGSQYRWSACSRSCRRTSASLTTPTGRPASLMTGAALIRRSVRNTTASWTVNSSRIETGLGVITSSARTACRRRGATSGTVSVLDMGASAGEGLRVVVPDRTGVVQRSTGRGGTISGRRPGGRDTECNQVVLAPEGMTLPDRRPRVLIVYNEPVLPPDHPDYASENDIHETVGEVAKVLSADEFEVERLGYARDPRALLDKLRAWGPDVVFNLFEGEADRTETEVYHAAVLEWASVPFTGSPAFALAVGRDKVRAKHLFRGAGLTTAAFQV